MLSKRLILIFFGIELGFNILLSCSNKSGLSFL